MKMACQSTPSKSRSTRDCRVRRSCSGTLKAIVAIMAMCLVSTRALDDQLRLVDNGYEGLVVAISDQVPQEHCNNVIHGVKVSKPH